MYFPKASEDYKFIFYSTEVLKMTCTSARLCKQQYRVVGVARTF